MLTGRRSSDMPLRRGPPGLLSQFVSHSPLSATVHQRQPKSCSGRSRTVADVGEHRPTLLESVLGASPRGFESRILRHADLRKRTVQAAARLLAHRHLAQFVATSRPLSRPSRLVRGGRLVHLRRGLAAH